MLQEKPQGSNKSQSMSKISTALSYLKVPRILKYYNLRNRGWKLNTNYAMFLFNVKGKTTRLEPVKCRKCIDFSIMEFHF